MSLFTSKRRGKAGKAAKPAKACKTGKATRQQGRVMETGKEGS